MTCQTKMQNLKILVSGDVQGKFKQLFSRVNRINKKNGPFDMLLCVGEFFGENNTEWEKCLETITVPIPTYILGPTSQDNISYFKDINGFELCDNIIYLGKKGVFNGSSGLKIAYLSGCETSAENNEKINFSFSDIKYLEQSITLINNYQGVDLLLTSQWPKHIEKYALDTNFSETKQPRSELISYLAKILKPRYHFAGFECENFERQPYRNHQVLAEEAQQVTRFIALADVDNSSKKKWLYAFSIIPIPHMDKKDLKNQPQDVTETPYKDLSSDLIKKIQTKDQGPQFFYDMSNNDTKHGKKRTKSENFKNTKHPKRQPRPQEPCWFCLSGPDIKKHLVVSVGTEAYVALAKGGIVPDHVVILPIGHCRSTLELPPEALEEVEKYKESIKKFYKSKGQKCLFYERNYKSPHLQIQCIPLPQACDSELICETFQNIGDSMNLELDEIPIHSDLSQIIDIGKPYFYVEFDDGTKLLHRLKKGMPINFGREVICSPPLLNMEEKIDWRECQLPQDEETRIASEFREAFEPFDFSL